MQQQVRHFLELPLPQHSLAGYVGSMMKMFALSEPFDESPKIKKAAALAAAKPMASTLAIGRLGLSFSEFGEARKLL